MTNKQLLAYYQREEQRLLKTWYSLTPPSATTPIGLDRTGISGAALVAMQLGKSGVHPVLTSLLSVAAYKGAKKLSPTQRKQYAKKANERRKKRNDDLIHAQNQIRKYKRIVEKEAQAQAEAQARQAYEEAERTKQNLKKMQETDQDKLSLEIEKYIPVADCRRNVYVVGKSGSGKSELLKTLFYKLQYNSQTKHDASLVLLDPHGDVAEELKAVDLNKNSDRLLYIDPYMQSGKTPIFNPLDLVDRSEESVEIHSQQIVKVFKEILQNVQLSNQMEALLKPCVTTLLFEGNMSLIDLYRFMDDNQNADLVAMGEESPIPMHRDFFKSQFRNPTFEKTKASISVKIQSLLNTSTFYNLATGYSTVDLEAAMNAGKVIIFNLSKGRMGEEASDAFGRFVIANIQSIALRRVNQKKADRVPTYVFIDECQNYITESIRVMLAETRKYGVHLVLANQYVTQLGTRTQQAILSNTAVKIAGKNDVDTFKRIAPNMELKISDLQTLPKYHFYIKSGDKAPALYASNDLLIKNEKHQLTKSELAALDQYIIHQSGVYTGIANEQ